MIDILLQINQRTVVRVKLCFLSKIQQKLKAEVKQKKNNKYNISNTKNKNENKTKNDKQDMINNQAVSTDSFISYLSSPLPQYNSREQLLNYAEQQSFILPVNIFLVGDAESLRSGQNNLFQNINTIKQLLIQRLKTGKHIKIQRVRINFKLHIKISIYQIIYGKYLPYIDLWRSMREPKLFLFLLHESNVEDLCFIQKFIKDVQLLYIQKADVHPMNQDRRRNRKKQQYNQGLQTLLPVTGIIINDQTELQNNSQQANVGEKIPRQWILNLAQKFNLLYIQTNQQKVGRIKNNKILILSSILKFVELGFGEKTIQYLQELRQIHLLYQANKDKYSQQNKQNWRYQYIKYFQLSIKHINQQYVKQLSVALDQLTSLRILVALKIDQYLVQNNLKCFNKKLQFSQLMKYNQKTLQKAVEEKIRMLKNIKMAKMIKNKTTKKLKIKNQLCLDQSKVSLGNYDDDKQGAIIGKIDHIVLRYINILSLLSGNSQLLNNQCQKNKDKTKQKLFKNKQQDRFSSTTNQCSNQSKIKNQESKIGQHTSQIYPQFQQAPKMYTNRNEQKSQIVYLGKMVRQIQNRIKINKDMKDRLQQEHSQMQSQIKKIIGLLRKAFKQEQKKLSDLSSYYTMRQVNNQQAGKGWHVQISQCQLVIQQLQKVLPNFQQQLSQINSMISLRLTNYLKIIQINEYQLSIIHEINLINDNQSFEQKEYQIDIFDHQQILISDYLFQFCIRKLQEQVQEQFMHQLCILGQRQDYLNNSKILYQKYKQTNDNSEKILIIFKQPISRVLNMDLQNLSQTKQQIHSHNYKVLMQLKNSKIHEYQYVLQDYLAHKPKRKDRIFVSRQRNQNSRSKSKNPYSPEYIKIKNQFRRRQSTNKKQCVQLSGSQY